MRAIFFSFLSLYCILSLPQSGHCAAANIDPCTLIAPEQIYTSFPELKTMKKQAVGSTTVCNFFDKYEIPAFIISLGKAEPTSAERSLSFLGKGYSIRAVSGLGDDAAVAIQQANPAFGLKEGIAMLYVKKGKTSLTLSPVRVHSSSVNDGLLKLKLLAAEMIKNL